MTTRISLFAILSITAGCTADLQQRSTMLGDKTSSSPEAVAMIEGRSGSLMGGYAEFDSTDGLTKLTLAVTGAPVGVHAVHLHEKGDCSSPDGESAGNHWNPAKIPHGQPGNGPAHLGDVGNLEVMPNGTGRLTFVSSDWSVGTGDVSDVLGKAMVVHARGDDFVSQPGGNAAGRIGCGVVVKPRSDPKNSKEPMAVLR